jgi:transcription factor C subunit 6
VSAGISDGSGSEESLKPTKPAKTPKRKGRPRKEETASDEDFVAPDSDAEMNDGPADDDDFDAVSEEAEEAEEIGDVDEMEVGSTTSTPKRKPTHARPHVHKRRPPNNEIAPSPDEIHFRGIMDPKDHVAKPMHYALTFGSDERDLLSAMYMRDRWFRGIDACLPTRFALEQPEGSDYGYGPTLGIEPADVETERTTGWDWLYNDTGKKLRKKQTLSKISETDALQNYFPAPKNEKHTVLMGPANQQTPIHLGYRESYNFGEIWKDIKARKSDQSAQTQVREGWLMNFGSKVQCMAWAPNQDGLSQYMAVVAPLSDEQKKIYHPAGSEPLSPFYPTPPYSCALQLWEFKGKKTGERTNTLNMDFEPRLRLALCSEWGDLRRMAWCPMGRERRREDETGDREHIGLLAGIWGDGFLRVVDVSIQRKTGKAEFCKSDFTDCYMIQDPRLTVPLS